MDAYYGLISVLKIATPPYDNLVSVLGALFNKIQNATFKVASQ